jgi:hypothetical protein
MVFNEDSVSIELAIYVGQFEEIWQVIATERGRSDRTVLNQ